MATRSAIAIRNSDATYDVVYCHWDGYPSHQRPILDDKYNTAKSVRKLLSKGDLSCLETDKDWNGIQREPAPLYYVERGETSCDPRNMTEDEMRQFAYNCSCEYLYTYLPRYGWRHDEL